LVGLGVLLDLSDKLSKATNSELVTLEHIKVDVSGFDGSVEIVVANGLTIGALDDGNVTVGDLDELLERGEADVHLDGVELQGYEREGVTREASEVEGQGNVETTRVLRVGHELSESEALTDHLFEAFTGLTGELFPHVEVVRVDGVDDLTTDREGSTRDGGESDLVDPVGVRSGETGAVVDVLKAIVEDVGDVEFRVRASGAFTSGFRIATRVARVSARETAAQERVRTGACGFGCDSGDIEEHVHPVNKITGAVQGHRDFRTPLWLTSKGLNNRFGREVSTLGDLKAPVGDVRVSGQMNIGRTESDHLGQSTTGSGALV